jgi:hypothetical protein
MLETEGNPIVFDKLAKDPYTRQSINKMRSSCYKISSGISKMAFRRAFDNMNWTNLKPVAFRDRFSELEKNNLLIQKAVQRIKIGDYITKFHYTTSGSHKQFFQLVDETNLRWTSKK